MAIAKSQQRAGGVTGVHVALIIFVALWLTSTVLLVWLYTEQEGLQKKTEDAVAGRSTAESTLRATRTDMGEIAQLAAGSKEDDAATVNTKVTAFFSRIRDEAIVSGAMAFDDPTVGMLAGMTSLYEAYQGEHQSRLEANKEAKSLSNEVERLNEEKGFLETAFGDKEEALVARITELETSWTDYRAGRDEQIDDVDSRMERIEQDNARDIQGLRARLDDLTRERDEFKSRYTDLQAKLGQLQITPTKLVTARQGDGVILTAKPGEDVVYINLGRKQQVAIGMQFAVYPSDEQVPVDGRGKARIEVARVFETTSECIIREMTGRSLITQGDVINNPIYERDRSLTFVVTGRFDVDGDGLADAAGREQIDALITDWGGQLATEVSASVDFVVVGDAPPKPSTREDLSAEQAERARSRQQTYAAYAKIVKAAQALSVPILPQRTFLHFLGYQGNGDPMSAGL